MAFFDRERERRNNSLNRISMEWLGFGVSQQALGRPHSPLKKLAISLFQYLGPLVTGWFP
jgi:hypothetical protein